MRFNKQGWSSNGLDCHHDDLDGHIRLDRMDWVIVTIGRCGHWEGHDSNDEGWDGHKICQDASENKQTFCACFSDVSSKPYLDSTKILRDPVSRNSVQQKCVAIYSETGAKQVEDYAQTLLFCFLEEKIIYDILFVKSNKIYL